MRNRFIHSADMFAVRSHARAMDTLSIIAAAHRAAQDIQSEDEYIMAQPGIVSIIDRLPSRPEWTDRVDPQQYLGETVIQASCVRILPPVDR